MHKISAIFWNFSFFLIKFRQIFSNHRPVSNFFFTVPNFFTSHQLLTWYFHFLLFAVKNFKIWNSRRLAEWELDFDHFDFGWSKDFFSPIKVFSRLAFWWRNTKITLDFNWVAYLSNIWKPWIWVMNAFFPVFVKKNTKLRKIRRFDFNCLKFNWMMKLDFYLWAKICENIRKRSTGCIFGFFSWRPSFEDPWSQHWCSRLPHPRHPTKFEYLPLRRNLRKSLYDFNRDYLKVLFWHFI